MKKILIIISIMILFSGCNVMDLLFPPDLKIENLPSGTNKIVIGFHNNSNFDNYSSDISKKKSVKKEKDYVNFDLDFLSDGYYQVYLLCLNSSNEIIGCSYDFLNINQSETKTTKYIDAHPVNYNYNKILTPEYKQQDFILKEFIFLRF